MEKSLYQDFYNLEKTHWWFEGRRRIVFGLLNHLYPRSFKTALDIGCGTGLNAELTLKKSEKVYGLEMSEDILKFSAERAPHVSMIKGEWPDAEFNQTFDLVTALDVLEHMEDEIFSFKKLENILSPGGMAVITLPAFEFLWSEHDEIAHHKRRYRLKDVEKLIKGNTGLKILRLTYFNTFLFPLIFFFRLAKNILGIKSGASDVFEVPAFLNKILAILFSSESFFLRYFDFPFGVSIFCAVKKAS